MKLAQVLSGGFGSVEVQIEAGMGIVVELEALGWLPPGPHLFEEKEELDNQSDIPF